MNDCVKSIYIYWVGLSNKNNAHDIRGLPTPIPIVGIDKIITIDVNYGNKHSLDISGDKDIQYISREYRYKNKIRHLPG